jgi:hypothetical protein
MQYAWNGTLFTMHAAGPTLTAAAAASMLVAASPLAGQNRGLIQGGTLKEGDMLRFKARGIISCAVTTPGTARFDLRMGAVIIHDSGALNLNIVAKANVPWTYECDIAVRAIGATTAANVWSQGEFKSEAVIASPLPAAGGNGMLQTPVSGLAVSSGFDSLVNNVFDAFFTQTVATGSLTCQMAELTLLT